MKAIIPNDSEANRDPLTGEAGAHPIGTGLGAAAGGMAAGAAVGTVAGPIGTLVGAAAGAIIGGLAGKSVGEAIDPTLEAVYWEETYVSEPYYLSNYSYEDYGPAYRTGYQGRAKYVGRTYAEVEGDLEDEYNRTKGNSRLEWVSAKPATQAAWHRVDAR
ncbi:MAG: hypothetical protein ABI630_09855 [Betaproteobacteria bacterium]